MVPHPQKTTTVDCCGFDDTDGVVHEIPSTIREINMEHPHHSRQEDITLISSDPPNTDPTPGSELCSSPADPTTTTPIQKIGTVCVVQSGGRRVVFTSCFRNVLLGFITLFFSLVVVVVLKIETTTGTTTLRSRTTPTQIVAEAESTSSMDRPLPSSLEEESIKERTFLGSRTLGESSSSSSSPVSMDSPLDLPFIPTWEEWIAMRRPAIGEESTAWMDLHPASPDRLEAVQQQTMPDKTKSQSFQPNAICNNEIPHPPLPGKKGAAFTLRAEGQNGSWVNNLPKVIRLNPYWNYSWGHNRIAEQPDHIEFVPMIWGYYGVENINYIITNSILPQIQNGQVKRLLGFNEPDNPLQASLSVERALEAWPKLEQTILPLISPSCQHPEREWMQNFAANVDAGCLRMEWVGVHWYGSASFENFKRAMETFYDLYQRPLLVKEFAPADWTAQTVEDNQITEAMVLDFMKQALPWLEATPWIAGYSWFSFRRTDPPGTSSALFDEAGELTTCGRYYSSITNETPQGDVRIGTDQDPLIAPVFPMGFGAILAFLCMVFG